MLTGATQWAASYRTSHPNEETAVVVIADDDPEGCDTNNTDLAAIAADAYATNHVRTYFIGLGQSDTVVKQIATAGATQAFLVPGGASLEQGVLAAFTAIRDGLPPSAN